MKRADIERVENCIEWLIQQSEDYTSQQSIAWYIDQLGMLNNSLAFVNEQMAIAEKALHEKKTKVYHALAASGVANQQYWSPMLAKDYVNARLSTEQYNYAICERCSRTIVHTIESVRSILSALKEEMKISNYAGQH